MDAHADLFASQFDVRTITRASIAFCTCIEQSQEQEGIGVNANVIAAAREAFERTRNEAAKCVTGEGHTALAAHWSSFLVRANRVFTKLKQGAKSGPASRWWQDVEHIRKDDELLRYILHARNADEHGIKRIAPSIPATPIGISFGPFGARRVMKPECTVMVPVWDRGKRYDPPTTHLAQPLSIIRPNGDCILDVSYATG